MLIADLDQLNYPTCIQFCYQICTKSRL